MLPQLQEFNPLESEWKGINAFTDSQMPLRAKIGEDLDVFIGMPQDSFDKLEVMVTSSRGIYIHQMQFSLESFLVSGFEKETASIFLKLIAASYYTDTFQKIFCEDTWHQDYERKGFSYHPF